MTENRLPPLAVLLTVAGLVPFLVLALNAARGDTATQHTAVPLLTYGAVVLSFIGAVHWGFVLEGPEEPRQKSRLLLGVLPGLVGWGAALLGQYLHSQLGMGLMAATFIAAGVVEQRGVSLGLVPRRYMILRWVITTLVVLILVATMVLRLTGGRMLF